LGLKHSMGLATGSSGRLPTCTHARTHARTQPCLTTARESPAMPPYEARQAAQAAGRACKRALSRLWPAASGRAGAAGHEIQHPPTPNRTCPRPPAPARARPRPPAPSARPRPPAPARAAPRPRPTAPARPPAPATLRQHAAKQARLGKHGRASGGAWAGHGSVGARVGGGVGGGVLAGVCWRECGGGGGRGAGLPGVGVLERAEAEALLPRKWKSIHSYVLHISIHSFSEALPLHSEEQYAITPTLRQIPTPRSSTKSSNIPHGPPHRAHARRREAPGPEQGASAGRACA
jgi:hypothetical protein